jgi:hypothetical protein
MLCIIRCFRIASPEITETVLAYDYALSTEQRKTLLAERIRTSLPSSLFVEGLARYYPAPTWPGTDCTMSGLLRCRQKVT